MKRATIAFSVMTMFLTAVGGATPAAAAGDKPGVMVVPLHKGEQVDGQFMKDLNDALGITFQKLRPFNIYDFRVLKEAIGKEALMALYKCGSNPQCVYEKASPYRKQFDYAVFGGAAVAFGEVELKLAVLDLNDGRVVNQIAEQIDPASRISDKQGMMIGSKLFKYHQKMVDQWRSRNQKDEPYFLDGEPERTKPAASGRDDYFEDEPAGSPARSSVPSVEPPRLPPPPVAVIAPPPPPERARISPVKVKDATRAAFSAFLEGDHEGALSRAEAASEMYCNCPEADDAALLADSLRRFAKVHAEVEAGIAGHDSKIILDNIQPLRGLDAELSAAARKAGAAGTSPYPGRIDRFEMQGQILRGRGLKSQGRYLDAVACFEAALKLDGSSADAKAEMEELPRIAQRVYLEASTMVDFDPDGARQKLEMVIRLVGPDNEWHQKASEMLEEIE